MSGRKVILFIAVVTAVVSAVAAWQIMRVRGQLGAFARSSAGMPPARPSPSGELVLIPYGTFLADEDQVPATLPAYYINRTEATVEAYARYARERGLPAPAGDPAFPVTGVSFGEAKAFCEWAGQRLPHPVEWEKAARGDKAFLYPWGNDANPARANIASPQLLPAGAKRESASPYGVLDMAGNAWEWVDDLRKPLPRNIETIALRLQPPPTAQEPWYSARGGSHLHPLSDARTYTFLPLPARYRAPDLGFRCVAPVTPR